MQRSEGQNRPLTAWILRVNPLIKILLTLVVLMLAFVLKTLGGLGVLVGALLVLLVVAVPVPFWSLLGGVVLLVGFTGVSAYFSGSVPYALITGLRVLGILLPAPLLAGTTPPADLVRALQALRLPAVLVLGVVLIWRFLPLIQQEAQRIIEANQLRGIDLKRQPQQWFSGVFTPLIFRMLSYADEVTVGLETRGYDPERPRSAAQPLSLQPLDMFFGLTWALILGSVGWWEWQR
ncbi:energy-coupling factor transporter transmembrane component T family protein [Anthocerotibacter panamensis]|uniref:energy-coupling factor transporter transmembrane component T family protein n=1 Tax=Anthocerotibacter panamensis TaxID=2857077 RepID=UPI001C4063B2|nr:energy-coupling factor transporter transmembrane component T [Anthocerotibacter panamensis]